MYMFTLMHERCSYSSPVCCKLVLKLTVDGRDVENGCIIFAFLLSVLLSASNAHSDREEA